MAKTKFHPFQCPWCLQPLKANNVVFRFSPDPAEDAEAAVDPYLADYYRNTTPKGEVVPSAAVPGELCDPAFRTPSDELLLRDCYLYGIKARSSSGRTEELRVRLCPYCHNPLYRDAGKAAEHWVSVAGASGAGKTSFLYGMLAQLAEDGFLLENVSLSPDGNFDTTLADTITQLQKGATISPTHTQGRQRPYTFRLTPPSPAADGTSDPKTRLSPFFLNVQDICSEHLQDINALRASSAFIHKAAGTLLLLIDCEDPAPAIQLANNLKALDDLVSGVNEGRIAVAVVLYKADRLKAAFPALPDYISFSPAPPYLQLAPIDLTQISYRTAAYRSQLVFPNQDLLTIYQTLHSFVPEKQCEWFIANALRISEENRKEYVLQPAGCDEPLLWSMALRGDYPTPDKKSERK